MGVVLPLTASPIHTGAWNHTARRNSLILRFSSDLDESGRFRIEKQYRTLAGMSDG